MTKAWWEVVGKPIAMVAWCLFFLSKDNQIPLPEEKKYGFMFSCPISKCITFKERCWDESNVSFCNS